MSSRTFPHSAAATRAAEEIARAKAAGLPTLNPNERLVGDYTVEELVKAGGLLSLTPKEMLG